MMAAGDSTRFCKDLSCKKQWLRIDEEPLWLVATRKILHYAFHQVFITASPADYAYMCSMCPKHIEAKSRFSIPCNIVQGGNTRTQSLRNALQCVDTPFVLVSDVARWNTLEGLLDMMENEINQDSTIDCVVPFLRVADTTFYQGDYLKREDIKLIQTPQLSKVSILREALKDENKDFSDESSAIHALGGKVAFVEGSPLMNKITFGSDLSFHIAKLAPPSSKTFVGQGIDVHMFEDSKPMWLGGIKIESPFGFKAHSDGDVVLHALCDAILGAIGGGDIGQWFPDTDMAYKGADSKILLKQIYTFAQSVGYELHNADISIMAQIPKLAPYKESMRQCIADILQVPHSRINIKATTTEGLGFVGRKEGVCAQAQVSMGFVHWGHFVLKEEL